MLEISKDAALAASQALSCREFCIAGQLRELSGYLPNDVAEKMRLEMEEARKFSLLFANLVTFGGVAE